MHTSHSCIIVTETPESEPVEPTESVEPAPGVEFVVEPEANKGKQLNMIPCTYLTWSSYFNWVFMGYVYYVIYCILLPIFMHYPSLRLFYPCPCHMLVN